MADEPDKSGQEPNLELPSLLSFGRKRKGRPGVPPVEGPASAPIAAEEPPADAAPAQDPVAADPVEEPRGGLAPSTDKAKRPPPVPPPTARPDAEPVRPQTPPPPDPPPPLPEEPAAPEPPEEPTLTDGPAPVEEPAAEQTTVLPVTESEPRTPEPVAEPVAQRAPEPFSESYSGAVVADYGDRGNVRVEESDVRVEQPADDSAPKRSPRSVPTLKVPELNPRIAVVVTGGLVGLLGVLLAYFASRGCETVRGVGSCGGTGLLALLVILVIEVVLGAIMLKAWKITDPTSTSFLGVGLVAVFVLLFLLSSLESVWMILIIPVLSSLFFLLSWWVTTAFVEGPDADQHR